MVEEEGEGEGDVAEEAAEEEGAMTPASAEASPSYRPWPWIRMTSPGVTPSPSWPSSWTRTPRTSQHLNFVCSTHTLSALHREEEMARALLGDRV